MDIQKKIYGKILYNYIKYNITNLESIQFLLKSYKIMILTSSKMQIGTIYESFFVIHV